MPAIAAKQNRIADARAKAKQTAIADASDSGKTKPLSRMRTKRNTTQRRRQKRSP
jgi:hypothetical protein